MFNTHSLKVNCLPTYVPDLFYFIIIVLSLILPSGSCGFDKKAQVMVQDVQ